MLYTYKPKESTILCEIMERNKSDKGKKDLENCWHNYTTLYHQLFTNMRDDNIRMFELGLGTNNTNISSNMGTDGRPCASLYGWHEYFNNVTLFGADIDKDILIENEKFKTFYCDQTNPIDINNLWNNKELLENFDIIIDDGLHSYDANVIFFENSIHKLKNNGLYIIEDINILNINNFLNKIDEWKIKYNYLDFKLIKIDSNKNNWDNNVLVINKLE